MEGDRDLQFKNVIDSCYTRILEDLDPLPLLDLMKETSGVTYHKWRDITETVTTTEKNKKIIELFRSKGPEDFKTFLHLLKQSGNAPLAEILTSVDLNDSGNESRNKGLQRHLIGLYNTMCVWENPVTTEQQCIPEMYVPPAVKVMREKKDLYGELVEVKEEMSSLLSYKTIFISPSGPCRNIYITGDAGCGKTTFCDQLVRNWCKAVTNVHDDRVSDKDEGETFSDEDQDKSVPGEHQGETVSAGDLKLLSSFKFLFYLNLRDTEAIYHVEDMIKEQLLYKAPLSLDLSDLLQTEKCLIVFDGLDEWSCPDGVKKCPGLNKHIPGRNVINETCVFLTTTRNWKFDVSELKTKDVDKHVELCGIDEKSSEELAQKMIDHLDRLSQRETDVDDFHDEIHQKEMSDLINVPVLLIQLVTLWHFGKDFGNSQLQLYCSMLDLLFERSEKNLPEKQSESTCITLEKQKKLPDCFSEKYFCHRRTELLLCLAEFAYKALFNKQKEEALVFRSSKLNVFGISQSDINLCLQCGILSQNKDFRNYAGRYKKFSFLHKKMQEFLAAIYIVIFDPVEDILNGVREVCTSLDIMLEMSQVWLFVSGMSPDITRQLVEHLAHIVSASKRIKNYRQSLDWHGIFMIREIQTYVTNCVIECDTNGHTYNDISLGDVYIDEYTDSDNERLLSVLVGSGIKSVCVESCNMTDNHVSVVTDLLQHCPAVQKLVLRDYESRIPSQTVTKAIENCCDCLTSLHLVGVLGNILTEEAVTAICHSSRKCLMSLGLDEVRMTHVDKERLLKELSQSVIMRELELRLDCTDHDHKCIHCMDVSTMTHLQKLKLTYICVDNLPAGSQCMEQVVLSNSTLPVTTLCEFARRMSQTRRQMTVGLNRVTVREESGGHVDLETFLRGCFALTVRKCEYCDSYNTWDIDFYTNSL